MCFRGELNYEEYEPQSKQYLYSLDWVITNGIKVMPQLKVWAPHARTHVIVRGWIVKDQWEKQS